MSHIAIDFETFYSKKLKYSLTGQIAEQYCRSEHFDPYLISASDGKSCWAGDPKNFNFDCLNGQVVVAHNLYFEKTVLSEMQVRKMIPTHILGRVKEFHCTANLTSFLCNRRSLDQAVDHLLKVELSKEARGDVNGKHWPKDFTPNEQKAMIEYAGRDSFYCHQLFEKFGHLWPVSERRLSNLTIEQGMRGVQINRELLDLYIMQSHEMKSDTENLLPWLTYEGDDDWEDFNTKPTSSKCIAEQCRRSGIPAPPLMGDEEAFEAWETQYAPKHCWIQAVSSWRSINKLYKTFLVVKERLRDDGTLPFGLKYFGAHTGRWSGDAKVNMQNMRKLPVVCNEKGLMECSERRVIAAVDEHAQTGKWPEWVRYTIDFRHLIIPRSGKRMIVSDLSQIEPRVLAWLAGDWAMLEMLKTGMSVYEAHARATMGWTGGKLKDENPEMYKLAKARVLALGYQAGHEKFITMAYTLARIDITKDDPEFIDVADPFTGKVTQKSGYGFNSKRTVTEFRAQNPNTVGLWNRLDDGFKRSIADGDFVMTLPSGRKMRYEEIRCETRIEPNRETGKPQRRAVFTANSDGRRKTFYGGKLTENLVQATSRDVFAHHLLKLEDAGVTNLFSVHDEAVIECDETVTAKDVEHIMSDCPEWLSGCPVGAEAKVVPHYLK